MTWSGLTCIVAYLVVIAQSVLIALRRHLLAGGLCYGHILTEVARGVWEEVSLRVCAYFDAGPNSIRRSTRNN